MSWASSFPGAGRDRGPSPKALVGRGCCCRRNCGPRARSSGDPPGTGRCRPRCTDTTRPRRGRGRGGAGSLRRTARRRRRGLRPGDARRLEGLTDSKLLTPVAREEYFALITRWAADLCVVVIPADEVDRRGVHIANIEGMRGASGWPIRPATCSPTASRYAASAARRSPYRRAIRWRRALRPPRCWPRSPGTGSWSRWTPRSSEYRFAEHKGYCTPVHDAARSTQHGPSPVHRYSFVNVRGAWASRFGLPSALVHNELLPVGSSDAGEGGLNGAKRRGSREVRDRNGAHALQGVPGHRVPVLLRRGDGAPLLPREFRRRHPPNSDGEDHFEVRMSDAWVWDMYRPARFVKNGR